jgi:23S rRNA (cytidine2498-2'-O)-methyltransferase
MHLLLSPPGDEALLAAEVGRTGVSPVAPPSHIPATGGTPVPLIPTTPLTFCRQLLPHATAETAPSIAAWANLLFARLPADGPWQLHVFPQSGCSGASVKRRPFSAEHPAADTAAATPANGGNRCRLIRETLLARLKQHRRQLLKSLTTGPFTPATSLVQLLLTAPDRGWLSVAPAPLPHQYRQLIVPFPGGEIPVANDKAAPARAFAKLVEAEQRLGRPIAGNETCVDLGASPGSWSYVALQRGARVIAVDRAPLRTDLMRNPRLTYRQGDAFRFVPDQPVDWLLCDVIAAPERSIELLLTWLREKRCRQFVVTIKFKGREDYAALEELKRELPALCAEFWLTRLCANKNEACAFGVR